MSALDSLRPSFVSVTYGAGGLTRGRTHDLVVRLKKETRLDPVPHLTCVGHTENEISEILTTYAAEGVGNIMALGGDPPASAAGYDRSGDRFRHAIDLVRFIREFNARGEHPGPRGFGIGVAGFPEGHPATPNRVLELEYLRQKVDAGADYICTQLFFDNHDFYDFRERCAVAGITVPILAGLMPIQSAAGYARTPELALCSRYPGRLQRKIHAAQSDEEISKIGMDWTLNQCYDLMANDVDGIHFYTLNRSPVTIDIFRRLGVSKIEL